MAKNPLALTKVSRLWQGELQNIWVRRGQLCKQQLKKVAEALRESGALKAFTKPQKPPEPIQAVIYSNNGSHSHPRG